MIKSVLLFVYHCWYLLRKNIIVKSGDVIFTRIKVAKMNIPLIPQHYSLTLFISA